MRTFEQWMKVVDETVYDIAGVSVYDLPDYSFRDEFDAGASPYVVAREVLEEAGWEDQE